jgi:hypothetical protein
VRLRLEDPKIGMVNGTVKVKVESGCGFEFRLGFKSKICG